MTANVHGPNGAGSFFHAPGTPGNAARQVGEWNGLQVVVADDPASLLADAAEEMTFAASETVEKDVGERKKPEKEKRVATVVPPVEAMAEMQRQMAERLARLLAAVKQAMGNPAALRQALEEFPDPTERHAALDWLEKQFADEPSVATMVRRERERFETEAAAEIQAGYNILGVEDEGIGGPGRGMGLYRRTILGQDGIGGALEEILKREGDGDFLTTVEFLRKAVGADLSAATPSTDKRELEAMNNDLYHLRALANFTREFDAELGALREAGGKPSLPGAGLETLRILCRAKEERVVMLDGLKGALGLEGGKDATYDVRALTQTYNLAHRFPPKLFTDEESRQRLLTACQRMLDAAIDVEDELAGDE